MVALTAVQSMLAALQVTLTPTSNPSTLQQQQQLLVSPALSVRKQAVAGEPDGEAVFLPTGCLALLDTLHRMRPRHHLIAADFDELPEVAIPGRSAPLVATTVGNEHSCTSLSSCG
jgi:hypothetical protein